MLVWSDRVFALVCAPRFIPFVIEGAARGGGSCRLPTKFGVADVRRCTGLRLYDAVTIGFLGRWGGPGRGGVGVAAGADGGGGRAVRRAWGA